MYNFKEEEEEKHIIGLDFTETDIMIKNFGYIVSRNTQLISKK